MNFSRRILVLASLIGLLVSLAACSTDVPAQTVQQKTSAAATANQKNLLDSTPIPVLTVSQERENLVKRAKRINVQNMTSCITLFSQSGAVVAFFPVAGKVSSLNSYLLPSDTVVQPGGYYSYGSVVIESADIDGAYGQNADGIFFFTADTDAYVEWKGDYFWSDACLSPKAPTILVQSVEPKKVK
jgi:hypothetical protein